ncbi:MAG: methyltransferase domain-containing protein [Chryseotalea sp.]
MVNLKNRSAEIEIMDDLACEGPVVDQTLRELETINTLLGGNYVTLNGIDELIKDKPYTQPLTLVDLGCGGGDILRLIDAQLKRKNIDANLLGIDANPAIIQFAQKHTNQRNISFEASNIFSSSFQQKKFDVAVATLFFHHFKNEELVSFLKQLHHQVTTGIVINDLHRHWFAYYSIKWLTALFSKSSMVKFDAPLSVARSFSKKDWQIILQDAGITHYTLRWMWAFRWQIIIKK